MPQCTDPGFYVLNTVGLLKGRYVKTCVKKSVARFSVMQVTLNTRAATERARDVLCMS